MAQQRPVSGHSYQMTKISGQFLNFRNFMTTGTPAIYHSTWNNNFH